MSNKNCRINSKTKINVRNLFIQLLSQELCVFAYTSSANKTTTDRMLITTETVLSIRFVLAHCSQSKSSIITCSELSSTCQAVFTFTTHFSAPACIEQSCWQGSGVTKDLSLMKSMILIYVVDGYSQALVKNMEP
ncbi:b2.2 [Ichnoviriform fugitivi]|uniref:B2.2 n=1 Tax=Ichnoviriform fugitivi TaxID=265522 RepID=A2Q0D3_9VIRU|nr:b2.2 [Ichnoviriform fugitivi]BAF45648.1 b2.2 [Ichnoviriform fugitivi]